MPTPRDGAAPAAADSTPADGAGADGADPATPTDDATQDGGDGQPFDPERARSTIAKLRGFEKDAKAKGRELEALKARLAELDNAKLSETEKLAAKVRDLEAREAQWVAERRDHAARSALADAATRAGAIYPDLLAERLRQGAELADDGRVTNAAALVAEARREYPALFRAPNGSADGGAGKAAPSADGMNELIRRAAGRT